MLKFGHICLIFVSTLLPGAMKWLTKVWSNQENVFQWGSSPYLKYVQQKAILIWHRFKHNGTIFVEYINEYRTSPGIWMVKSCPIAEWSVIWMPFEYRTKFSFFFFFKYPSRLLFIFHCCLSLPYHKGRTTAWRWYSGEKPEYPE